MKTLIFLLLLALTACGGSSDAPKVKDTQPVVVVQSKPTIIFTIPRINAGSTPKTFVSFYLEQPIGQNYFDGMKFTVFFIREEKINLGWFPNNRSFTGLYTDQIVIKFDNGETFNFWIE